MLVEHTWNLEVSWYHHINRKQPPLAVKMIQTASEFPATVTIICLTNDLWNELSHLAQGIWDHPRIPAIFLSYVLIELLDWSTYFYTFR